MTRVPCLTPCFSTSSFTIWTMARWNSPSSQVESVMKLFIEAWFLYSRNDLLMDETFFLSGMAMSPVRYLIAFSICLRSSKPDLR